MVASLGYHAGELAMQRRAGVTGQAARLAGMVGAGQLRGGVAQFLAGRTFAALSARDADGTPWVSPLIGEPGFLEAADLTTLRVHHRFPGSDPLHDVAAGSAGRPRRDGVRQPAQAPDQRHARGTPRRRPDRRCRAGIWQLPPVHPQSTDMRRPHPSTTILHGWARLSRKPTSR